MNTVKNNTTIHLQLNQLILTLQLILSNDLFNKVCVPNKTEDLNLNIFNIISGINESKTLTKHISWECKYKFNGRNCNLGQWWNNDKCRCECKKRRA